MLQFGELQSSSVGMLTLMNDILSDDVISIPKDIEKILREIL